MAIFYLINPVVVDLVQYLPGALVDDETELGQAIIASAGVTVWPSDDPFLIAAATAALHSRQYRAANELELEQIMTAAVGNSQQAAPQLPAFGPEQEGMVLYGATSPKTYKLQDVVNTLTANAPMRQSGDAKNPVIDMPLTSVATTSDMTMLDITGWQNGSRLYVVSLKCFFFLDLLTGTSPDNHVYFATSGAGVWVRDLSFSHPDWTAQSVWYIKSGGSYDADGKTSGTAIPTWAELMRRWGNFPSLGNVTVNLLSALTGGDPLVCSFHVRVNSIVKITGASNLAVQHTGTCTAYTDVTRATNAYRIFEDSAFAPFGTYQNWMRVRLTSGAHAGAITWIDYNLTGKTALVTTPVVVGADGTTVTPVVPAVNDAYVLENPQTANVYLSGFDVTMDTGGYSGAGGVLVIDSLRLLGVSAAPGFVAGTLAFTNCAIDGPTVPEATNLYFTNCSMGPIASRGGEITILAGMMAGTVDLSAGAGTKLTIDGDTSFKVGATITAPPGSYVVIKSAFMMNAALVLKAGAAVRIDGTSIFGAGYWWGYTPSGSYIATLAAGATLSISSAANVTVANGGGSTFSFNGRATARGWDESTGSWTPAVAATVANLNLALGSGGCGGNMQDVQSGAKVVVES